MKEEYLSIDTITRLVELENIINNSSKQVKELLDCVYLYEPDNVNLIDRLELILKKLRGKDNENN